VKQGGVSVDAALAEAKSKHETGDLRAAARLYRTILARDPKCAAALNFYGILASQTGDHTTAVKRIKKAIAIDGNAIDYRINLGVVLETAGDQNSAFEVYNTALAIAPANVDLLSRLATAAQYSGRYEEFAATLSKLSAAMPNYAEAHFLYGQSLNSLRRFEEAATAFRHATTLAPQFAQAHADLASALMDMGDPTQALQASDDCLRLDPGNSFALATKTIALAECGEQKRLRLLTGGDELMEIRMLDVPDTYGDIASFNKALETAALSHPSLNLDPNHRSCHFADQTGDIFQDAKGVFATLRDQVCLAAENYTRKLSLEAIHPFLANPMPPTELVGWATVMRSQGHQSAHIHPTSWLSGVYYVTVPDLVKRGDNSHKGWIEFGRPPEHYPITVDPDVTFIEPVEGKLILFPSYLYHRTVSYEDDAMRISIAFDFDTSLVGES